MSNDKAYRALHLRYCDLERKLAAAQERLTEPAVQLAIERELEEIVYLTKELAAAQDEIKRLRGKCAAIEGNEIGYPCVALSEAQAQRDKAVFALQGLLEDITDYQTINNLGGEINHWQVIARAVLKECGK